jgi:hypothetical protein
MIPSFKQWAKDYLLHSKHLRLTKTTDPAKVGRFMTSVAPVETQAGLLRIGGDRDGGYLVPNDLQDIEACFSPGVSDTATFEEDLAARGMRCYLADYSVDGPPTSNPRFHFQKKFLGPQDSDVFMRLDSWVQKMAPDGELLLQMDIEGAEYGVVLDASAEILRRFRIIVMEVHGLDDLWDPKGFELINLAFTKLLNDFQVVHIHPNNCCLPVVFDGLSIPPVMEFTLIRRDRIVSSAPATTFPHPLDKPNVAGRADFALPECWRQAH